MPEGVEVTYINRAVLIVIDSLGIGELPDAEDYNDTGSHTLDNVAKAVGGLRLPNLASFGLGLIEGVRSVDGVAKPAASYGRMREASTGKDTTTGHWEIAGLVIEKPFRTFPEGFPPELMRGFAEAAGHGWLFAKPASGTEIIERFGAEHIRTGKLIVYTSADSVFQIAAHEDVVPLDELYRICEAARSFLNDYNVARVIARPFRGVLGEFERTTGRKDFSMSPPGETLLDILKKKGHGVTAIGKIADIFCHRGITEELHASSNAEVIDRTIEGLSASGVGGGLIFSNLVDFDMLYGHRNDPRGYARELEEFDRRLPELTGALKDEDLLILTADHGCDPTTPSTDHSREYVPLLVYGSGLGPGVPLGTRATFSDLGQTLAEFFGVGALSRGTSFLGAVLPGLKRKGPGGEKL